MNLIFTLCFLLTAVAIDLAAPLPIPNPKCQCTAQSHCGCVDGHPCHCGEEKPASS